MSYVYRDEIILPNQKYLNSLPPPSRAAELFRLTLERIPLFLESDELIAGRYTIDARPYERAPRGLLWQETFSEEESGFYSIMRDNFGFNPVFGKAHTCIDYEKVLNEGLSSYIARVEKRLTRPCTEKQRSYLEAMMSCLKYASLLSERFSGMARAMSENETDTSRKSHLIRMADALERVPMEPARDFFEALQSVWLMHSLVPIAENCWASISLGRFDQYMYPFYENATEEEKTRIPEYLEAFFKLLETHGDGACALNLGGLDADGNDMTNKLTYLILDVEKRCRYRSPIIAARISEKTPDKLMNALVDETLFNIGQPTFYSERNCRRALEARGVDSQTAVNFANSSCMGIVIPGCEVYDMWGSLYNSHLPLEMAVNGGKPFAGELPIEVNTHYERPETFEELMSLYGKYFIEFFGYCVQYNNKTTELKAYNDPDPFYSALTEDCIENACDRALGCRYRTVTVETMGLTNTADALTAIKKLVFDEKKYSLEQFAEAAKKNYEGFDELRHHILSCPKYGTDEETADHMVTQLFELAYRTAAKFSSGNTYFCPSLHTLDSNVSYGKARGATLDGRLAGEPLNKNAGPSNKVRKSVPTSLILSAGRLPQHLMHGGQPVDISFNPSDVRNRPEKITALIKTYLSMNGLQLQVNAPDIELLKAADSDPDSYNTLIVRIGGYSCYFTQLSKDVRKEFIERFSAECH